MLERILDRVRVGGAVAVDAAERRPRLGGDAVRSVELAERLLGEERVQLDLVDRRNDARAADQVLEMAFAEVRDADRASATVGQHLLDRCVRGDRAVEVARDGMVEQEEVDVVEAESAQAAVEPCERLFVAVVADPQLRGHEDVVAVDAGAADAFADLALIAVGGGGVEQPVAARDRCLNGADGLSGRALEDAEAESGQFDAVVQRDTRGGLPIFFLRRRSGT